MAEYVSIPIETEPDALAELSFDYLEDVSGEEWTPADGNLDVWLLIAVAHMAAEVRDVASDVPASIFRYLGSQIFNIQPLDGSSAVGITEWTARDNLGHTIPVGTVVGMKDADGDVIYFETNADTPIPVGETVATNVAVVSFDETSDANGLTGPIDLIDQLDFVAGVTITDPTSGGADEELDEPYLNRLTLSAKLFAPRPIHYTDFAMMGLTIGGVFRMTAIDLYDPGTDTYDNERTVSVAGIQADGTALNILQKNEVKAYLEGAREANFQVFVIDPTFNLINVTYSATVYPGYDPADVLGRADEALAEYLNPSTWGGVGQSGYTYGESDGNFDEWTNKDTIEEYELATILNNVRGLDRLTALSFAKDGDTLAQTPVVMDGAAPLPKANTLTGTVV